MAKTMTMITIDPEVKFLAAQVATSYSRSLSNFIEYLLLQEIQKSKQSGFSFVNFNEASTEYVGRGTDEKLVEEFEKLTKKGK